MTLEATAPSAIQSKHRSGRISPAPGFIDSAGTGRHLAPLQSHRNGCDRDRQQNPERHGGRSLYRAARRARHRICVRQRRNGFCADCGGALPHRKREGPALHDGPARERRHGHGARLLPDLRQTGRRDGARHRRHRQCHQRHHQRRARQHSGPARRRAHAADRDRQHRVAQPADSLGPRGVRPGRHAARIREMGLRAARRPAGGRGGRPRPRHRHERAARAGLPDLAARGAHRALDRYPPRHRAPARCAGAGTCACRDRGGGGAHRQGRVSDDRDMNLPTDHPMHLSHDPGAFLPKADVVIVIDSAVPWMARNHTPRKDAKIIHISADPLETRYPFRELEADLLVSGNSLAAMTMLRATLAEAMKGKKTAIESRRKALAAMREEIDARRRKLIETVKDQTPIHPAWLAACINQVKSEDAIVISELGAPLPVLQLTKPLSFMGGLLSGGLGFGLGAGLGAKLAAPEREVIVTVGDGSYMFGNPVPYHYVARAENLPTLTVVANNQSWLAVRQSTLDVFPDGHAVKANVMALTELKPSPDYEKVIETCGGRGEKVEGPKQLIPALERSLEAVRAGTPVTLNVQTQARR